MPITWCEGIERWQPLFPGISSTFGAHDVEVAVNIGFVCVSFLRALYEPECWFLTAI